MALHHKIAQVLRSRLESGIWSTHGALATEQRLCEEFGASRTTVRQALGHLKQAGLLESRTGVGTRGVSAPVKRMIVPASGDPLHAALDTRPRIVTVGEVACPQPIAAFFGIAVSAPICHFVRVHMLDGKPLSVVDSYFPLAIGKAFDRAALRRPIPELLWERHGLRVERSVHSIRVGRADLDIAALLCVALADPVLRIQSSAYLPGGVPIRWTENYFREDRYEYVAELDWTAPAKARKRSAPAAKRTR